MIEADASLRDSEGRTVWCRLFGKKLYSSATGNGILWIIVDITERKKLEDFKNTIEQIMRHDLKSPLTSIINIPELIMMQNNSLNDKEKNYLKTIVRSADRMINMINASLNLSKIENGTYKLNLKDINIVNIIEDIQEEMSSVTKQKSIEIKTVLSDEPAHIKGDETLFYSSISNLLKNAVEAAPKNSIITIRVKKDKNVIIDIHNYGVIPTEIRPVFFEKYATSGKKQGTGLGTYSAKLMVNKMNGDISFKTNDETGTNIIIEFPII